MGGGKEPSFPPDLFKPQWMPALRHHMRPKRLWAELFGPIAMAIAWPSHIRRERGRQKSVARL